MELIRQNPQFTEAPGPKTNNAPLSAPFSDANRSASMPHPTGDKPTLRPGQSDAHYLRAAKWFTVLWGALAIGFATFASLVDNLIQAVNILGSLFYGTILGIFEIGVFVVLAVLLIIHAGSANTLSVFGTGHTPVDHAGIKGVIAGSVYTILAFGGFEGAAPLAEEARNPRRTIPRAIMLATLLIGLLYVFTTYAVDVAFGPAKFGSFSTVPPNSWEGLARSLYGLFWFFVFLAIVNSTIANANAGVNVSSRTAYAMGRIGAFPRFLAQVHPKHRSPVMVILTGFVITVDKPNDPFRSKVFVMAWPKWS